MVDKTLKISEIDFTKIKSNLKQYLKNQSEFTDMNFEGSALSTLLDILAYNTHYMSTYANFAFSEGFLDSATQRGAIVSRAKELGYLPRSKAASKASVTLSFGVTGNPLTYVLPKWTRFTSTGTSYTFLTTQEYLFENSSNTFSKEIEIVEGKNTTYEYTVNLSDSSQRFIIPSKDVDVNYLTVVVKDSVLSSTQNTYSFIDNLQIGDLDPTTTVYFLRETFDGYFEVYFGDGVVGKALQNGNVVQLTFIITNGSEANNARNFTISSSLSGVSGVSVVTQSISGGGDDKENTDSIKYLAPFYYQSQNRAVTEDDYISLIKNKYPSVDDVSVWGGENNDPPYYGKVFVAVKPKNGLYLTENQKNSLKNDILSNFNVVSVRPEVVDPDFINVVVDTVVTYNGKLYKLSSNIDLEQEITDTIETFFSQSVNKFGKPLYYSNLVRAINDTNDLVLDNITNLSLFKKKEIFSGISGTYQFSFNNSIYPGSVYSNEITIDNVNWKIKDVPSGTLPYTEGVLKIYRQTQNQTIYLTETAGTVNYNTGVITLENIRIDAIVGDPINKELKMYCSLGSFSDVSLPNKVYMDKNIYANGREQIITLENISVTLLTDNSV